MLTDPVTVPPWRIHGRVRWPATPAPHAGHPGPETGVRLPLRRRGGSMRSRHSFACDLAVAAIHGACGPTLSEGIRPAPKDSRKQIAVERVDRSAQQDEQENPSTALKESMRPCAEPCRCAMACMQSRWETGAPGGSPGSRRERTSRVLSAWVSVGRPKERKHYAERLSALL